MFGDLKEQHLKGAIEALLFVTDEPVSTLTLADMLEVEPREALDALSELSAQFAEEQRGIELREIAGGWRLFTSSVYHELVERYVLSWDTRKLSGAAMETLAIVAYLQPITRSGVAHIRGVNSDSSLNSLVEKGLVREAGVADTPGNPVLYATTKAFLEKFGLKATSDLPELDQFAPDDEARLFIRERLSATRGEMDLVDSLRVVQDNSLDENAVSTPQSEESPQAMLAQAMVSGFGAVEKINFDELVFETDDE